MSCAGGTAFDIPKVVIGCEDIQHVHNMDFTITSARQLTSPSLDCKGSEQECEKLLVTRDGGKSNPSQASSSRKPTETTLSYHDHLLC